MPTHIKGIRWRFYSAFQWVIFSSRFPNNFVMTRKSPDPRHLKTELQLCTAKMQPLMLPATENMLHI